MRSLLIANRGEIACRIIRTAKNMGIHTIAVYSAADHNARHVTLADEAHYLGPALAKDSYLSIPALLHVAKQAKAEAIHPGYGFLSENAEFAEACAKAGLIFVGPSAAAIRLMGSKSGAKAIMIKAGVPVVPGYHEADQSINTLQQAADRIGYPVLLKAVSGGGGKGMRIVNNAKEFPDALAAAKREALASFNDDSMLLEKYITAPRHVEIQIFADTHGNVVHLFERDCSIQRRHQKVLEEAPAPHMTPELRAKMGQAAIQAAKAINYVGAGTIEFLLDANGQFYFMEMNTRLQVEHPITEKITGQDLVEWQLKVADQQPLPLLQDVIQLNGHAMEVRIYAEDPQNNFLPATGHIDYIATPEPSSYVRIDTGVNSGDVISVYYDPLIAKLIVWDKTREACAQRLQQALAEYHVVGLTTNIHFLRLLAKNEDFLAAKIDTGFIECHKDTLCQPPAIQGSSIILAALFKILHRQPKQTHRLSPWAYADSWALNHEPSERIHLIAQEKDYTVSIEKHHDSFTITGLSHPVSVKGHLIDPHTLIAEIAQDVTLTAVVVPTTDGVVLLQPGYSDKITWQSTGQHYTEAAAAGSLSAPMPGMIVAVPVTVGARVAAGDPLIVMEAMKMEHTLTAPAAGVVTEILYEVGALVREGEALLRLEILAHNEANHANANK